MSNAKNRIELSKLIIESLEGTISAERFTLLDRILAKNPEAVEYYNYFLDIHAHLKKPGYVFSENFSISSDPEFDIDMWQALAENEKTAPGVLVEKPIEKPVKMGMIKVEKVKRTISRFSIYTLALSTAAVLLFIVMILLTPVRPIVATLTNSINAEWISEDEMPAEGDVLRQGTYYLEKGLVQILFDNGAKVILEGPADFELSSTSAMELFSGKVIANINREAVGFTVKTPSAKVLDLGTEFGVDVDLAGDSDIHVFEGEVVLYPQNNGGKVLLLKGKAKRISTSGQQKDIDLNEYDFVHQDEFNARVKAQQGDLYHRWLAYSYQLRHDPGLVAYYIFEKDNDNPDKLNNVAVATAGKCNGLLLSGNNSQLPTWTQGRWPNKTALEFDRIQKQMVEVPIDPVLNIAGKLTVAAWINCPNDNKGGMLVSNRSNSFVNYQVAVFGDKVENVNSNSIQFYRRNDVSVSKHTYSKPYRNFPSGWTLVCVTHDNEKVNYYFNGQLYDTRKLKFKSSPELTELLICSVRGVAGNDYKDQMFNGTIGELAIFKRVLSDQELAEMYEAGKPK